MYAMVAVLGQLCIAYDNAPVKVTSKVTSNLIIEVLSKNIRTRLQILKIEHERILFKVIRSPMPPKLPHE